MGLTLILGLSVADVVLHAQGFLCLTGFVLALVWASMEGSSR